MERCLNCGKESRLITRSFMTCVACIREEFEKVRPRIEEAHSRSREAFLIPSKAPRKTDGVKCTICASECMIPDGKRGFCGLRQNQNGKLTGAGPKKGNLSFYYDPLPTNCVADWVCPGGTGEGYPDFAYSPKAEYGYKNLAVFYQACSFNCMYCQNWQYRKRVFQEPITSPDNLAGCVDSKTSCICFFGGDPSVQLPHAILASRIALEKNKDRILRICWETNGTMNPLLLDEAAELSLKSGGCIKIDLKAWNESLHQALTGVSNKRTFENFKRIAFMTKKRPHPPPLIASTLLVPGYIDEQEVSQIARFIASLNPEIPYSLLGFYPHFYMVDLPKTSRKHALRCKELAEMEGLKNVRVGNIHLLSNNCA
ncbi:MAG: radical SAM protein [Thermodesulfobacteriota bacterium]|nr:radical SAM protein [Thermodesulfobacteriota bacterium]